MKRINVYLRPLLLAITALGSANTHAAGAQAMPYHFEPDPDNLASVQRGARNFMNYCAGCHSMQHLRYNRLAADLGIPEDLLQKHLMFTTDKPGDPILSAMPATSAQWFGAKPPDLSVETRMRGPAWVYNYLMTFYVDPSRPLGTNNLMLPGASMPHVLGALQGWQIKEDHPASDGAEGHGTHAAPRFVLASAGKLSPQEYEKFVADTVNFMVYAAEPGRAGRIATGVKVMLFLLVFTVLAWLLKREYWKDVH
ncbi:ubiquinol-cytochrome c reductase cytochrome c1 subunit [Fontimonas thermophila]|uniref:Ubiquinol-cytochrome c reductase cytochrome c1 subunit n=1 Tax=Fontimonas thermophila TaxID=1076937 RepID=A0A1I2IBX4_9GAMM|nr:cytochrome c1 [Fontimonas thermophila]SFF38346.1 ubiquinol-cytochrome c reductase cytochrome c1 subunit [Fontimonas thermophila]